MSRVESVLSLVITHFSRSEGITMDEVCSRFASVETSRGCRKLSQRIIGILEDVSEFIASDDCDEEIRTFGEEGVYDEEEYDSSGSFNDDDDFETPAAENSLVLFSRNVNVTLKRVREAVAYYRSSEKGSRSLSCMVNRFRFIRTKHDLQKVLFHELH